MKLKLIKSLVIWNGPTEHIWSDGQCQNIGRDNYYSLDQCKNACLEKTGCTAINRRHGNDCVFRACTQPVPDPAWKKNGYNGYYVAKGTI